MPQTVWITGLYNPMAAQVTVEQKRQSSREDLLKLLADGHKTVEDLGPRMTISVQAIKRMLRKLLDEGKVERTPVLTYYHRRTYEWRIAR